MIYNYPSTHARRAWSLGARRHLIAVTFALMSLVLGCDSHAPSPTGDAQPSWLTSANVVDLTQDLSAQPENETLLGVKGMGFDTVLLDSQNLSDEVLDAWLSSAAAQSLKVAVWMAQPKDSDANPAISWPRLSKSLSAADALILTVAETADLDAARQLRSTIHDADSDIALIAYVADDGGIRLLSSVEMAAATVFDAVITFQIPRSATRDGGQIDHLIAEISQESGETISVENASLLERPGIPQWRRLSHCEEATRHYCSEDIRLLVAGFMQPSIPITAVLGESYWHDVYQSLIRIRKEHPWIQNGTVDWYETDSSSGAVAYRITNKARAHLLVALSVSDNHLELPLPFGFMADSKIKLWTSYDPTLRELVTSKPVALPARSAVVVIKE